MLLSATSVENWLRYGSWVFFASFFFSRSYRLEFVLINWVFQLKIILLFVATSCDCYKTETKQHSNDNTTEQGFGAGGQIFDSRLQHLEAFGSGSKTIWSTEN